MLKIRSLFASLLALMALAMTGMAQAAVDTEVTSTLTAAKADVTTIGVAVFAIIVAIAVFKWFRKAL